MNGPASTSWKLWHLPELPIEWQQKPDEATMDTMATKLGISRQELTYAVCITMPECQLSKEYMKWAQEQAQGADDPGLLIENVDEWIETNNYPDLVTWGNSFLRNNRPPMCISGVFGKIPKK